MIGYGLIAGISYHDMLEMLPGEILDYFLMRREYDDARAGIRRM